MEASGLWFEALQVISFIIKTNLVSQKSVKLNCKWICLEFLHDVEITNLTILHTLDSLNDSIFFNSILTTDI